MRFDPAWAARLDDPQRLSATPPAELWALLDAPQGALVVDFGTGTGLFALELARARPDLRIAALDEQAPMLDHLRAKLAAAPAPGVEPVLTGTPAAEALVGQAARVLALNVLHEVGDAALAGLRALLAPGGRALFVDWNAAVEDREGPPAEWCYTPERARARLEAAGLRVVEEGAAFPTHFALVCEAP
ncbi:MAG: class I SAM-dependent methyltransferase [Planctomycetota bacterium]